MCTSSLTSAFTTNLTTDPSSACTRPPPVTSPDTTPISKSVVSSSVLTVKVVDDVDVEVEDVVVDEVVKPEVTVVLEAAGGAVVVVEAGLAQAAKVALSKTARNEVVIIGV